MVDYLSFDLFGLLLRMEDSFRISLSDLHNEKKLDGLHEFLWMIVFFLKERPYRDFFFPPLELVSTLSET